jgi:hypothetical protein
VYIYRINSRGKGRSNEKLKGGREKEIRTIQRKIKNVMKEGREERTKELRMI